MCFTVSVLITDLRERMTALLVWLTQTLPLFPHGSFNSSLRSLLNIYLFTLVTNKEMHHFCSFSTKIYLHNGIIGGIIFPFCESCTAFCSTMADHVDIVLVSTWLVWPIKEEQQSTWNLKNIIVTLHFPCFALFVGQFEVNVCIQLWLRR